MAGQLEQELADNAWLTAPANTQILFDLPYDQRYQAAIKLLNVDLAQLSGAAHVLEATNLPAPTGTTLAFDFGLARIGVAEGDAEVGTAPTPCSPSAPSAMRRVLNKSAA